MHRAIAMFKWNGLEMVWIVHPFKYIIVNSCKSANCQTKIECEGTKGFHLQIGSMEHLHVYIRQSSQIYDFVLFEHWKWGTRRMKQEKRQNDSHNIPKSLSDWRRFLSNSINVNSENNNCDEQIINWSCIANVFRRCSGYEGNLNILKFKVRVSCNFPLAEIKMEFFILHTCSLSMVRNNWIPMRWTPFLLHNGTYFGHVWKDKKGLCTRNESRPLSVNVFDMLKLCKIKKANEKVSMQSLLTCKLRFASKKCQNFNSFFFQEECFNLTLSFEVFFLISNNTFPDKRLD